MRSSFDGPRKMKTLGDIGFIRSLPGAPFKEEPIDPEAVSREELNEAQRGFAERAKAENARRELATDSEYWCCLCFQSREQAEAFSAAFDLEGEKYIDGRIVARSLGIDLPANPVFGRVKIDKRLKELPSL